MHKFEIMLMEAHRKGYIEGFVKSFSENYAETFRDIFGEEFEDFRPKIITAGKARAFASLVDDGTLTLPEAVEKSEFPEEKIKEYLKSQS